MSPRPKRYRKIENPPLLKGFKPIGIPFQEQDFISIQFEEYEALKLADYENLSHEQASKRMDVSRPTFTRIYEQIRKKLARAFVEGIPVIIEGGQVILDKQWFRCNDCYHIFYLTIGEEKACPHCQSIYIEHINESLRQWGARKGIDGRACRKRSPDISTCPGCGYRVLHQPGTPCHRLKCPKCNITLIRG